MLTLHDKTRFSLIFRTWYYLIYFSIIVGVKSFDVSGKDKKLISRNWRYKRTGGFIQAGDRGLQSCFMRLREIPFG